MSKPIQLNNKYDIINSIRNCPVIEEEFQQKLFNYFYDEFHKVYLSIIIKLFKKNLIKIRNNNFSKIIYEKEESIHLKVESAYRNATERLTEK